ncbi:MAG: hypothetical protein IPL78_19350 [Chloroflexi bacterium]|nr:hypothetical protein [Chloroflexota bacterium]
MPQFGKQRQSRQALAPGIACPIPLTRYNGLMKVFLDTIGCRLNQSEIETMARQLLANGHEVVDDAAAADTVILNTCAVTHEAARDARKLTRRFHRANPTANIVLTGCYATLSPQELAGLDGVNLVVANRKKAELIQLLYAPQPAIYPFLSRNRWCGSFGPGVWAIPAPSSRCRMAATTNAPSA